MLTTVDRYRDLTIDPTGRRIFSATDPSGSGARPTAARRRGWRTGMLLELRNRGP